MASYLYHCYIYHDTTDVIGINPTDEADKVSDFESNYRTQSTKVDDIIPNETMFDILLDYADFKDLIVSPITWDDVKYAEEDKAYDLYLLSSTPLGG